MAPTSALSIDASSELNNFGNSQTEQMYVPTTPYWSVMTLIYIPSVFILGCHLHTYDPRSHRRY